MKSAGNDRLEGPGSEEEHYVWDNGWEVSTVERNKDGGPDGFDCIGTQGTSKNILTGLANRLSTLVTSTITEQDSQTNSESELIQQFNSQFEHFQDDAPACDICGSITVRNGTCYKCFNCGNSMGCS